MIFTTLRDLRTCELRNCELRTANCEPLRTANCEPLRRPCEDLRNHLAAKRREATRTDSAKSLRNRVLREPAKLRDICEIDSPRSSPLVPFPLSPSPCIREPFPCALASVASFAKASQPSLPTPFGPRLCYGSRQSQGTRLQPPLSFASFPLSPASRPRPTKALGLSSILPLRVG